MLWVNYYCGLWEILYPRLRLACSVTLWESRFSPSFFARGMIYRSRNFSLLIDQFQSLPLFAVHIVTNFAFDVSSSSSFIFLIDSRRNKKIKVSRDQRRSKGNKEPRCGSCTEFYDTINQQNFQGLLNNNK
jgi:hypothetical protein